MRKIEAIIKPYKLDDVKSALLQIGIQAITISEVRGFGRQKGHTVVHRGREYTLAYQPKVKVEIVVPQNMAFNVVQTIRHAARTGRIGDGTIFVSPIDNVIRIRTQEYDSQAL